MDKLQPLLAEDTRGGYHSKFGPPPTTWRAWTVQAEQLLLRHTHTDPKGNRRRGTTPRTAPQRVGRQQVGHTGYAGSRAHIQLRLRVLRYDRLQLLTSKGACAEARHLRVILGDREAPTDAARFSRSGNMPRSSADAATGSLGLLPN